jgi:hypothetical protein
VNITAQPLYIYYLAEALADAKRLSPRIFFPYLKKIYGKGIMATVKKARRLVAH